MKFEIHADTKSLQHFVKTVLIRSEVPENDAEITADVLLLADRRGIASHGIARLQRYLDGLASGGIKKKADIRIIKETPVSMVVDGGGGLGQVIAFNMMNKLIDKAKENFMAFASIRNSNHYGIAGYYSLMATERDMIGISLTNAAPLVIPTHGRTALFGTNPISLGVPTNKETAFLIDMATSTVPRGKLEVYSRINKKIPDTWATDQDGLATHDPGQVLSNLLERRGGGLLPLGGENEETGGHKGFCLAMMVELLCSCLSDGKSGLDVYKDKTNPGVCHFLGVINPEAFSGITSLKQNMAYFIDMCQNSPKATGKNHIYYPGEKEHISSNLHKETVPLDKAVFDNLCDIAKEFDLQLFEYKEKES